MRRRGWKYDSKRLARSMYTRSNIVNKISPNPFKKLYRVRLRVAIKY
jgi:hypothetical protein